MIRENCVVETVVEVRCVARAEDRLGEGPCWSPLEQRLYWFDIKGQRLSWCAADGGGREAFDLPVRASAAAPRASGGLLVATEKGLAHIDPDARTFEITQPHDLGPGFRTNDGKIDLAGCFWWSSMDDNGGERPGAVFRTEPNGRTERMLTGIHIPNTIAASRDGTLLYLADSKRQTIFAYRLDELSQVYEFAHTRGEAGTPDGSAVDAEGFLWNAQWGAWRVVRYAPDGRIDRIVDMPVEQPSSCAFGGPDLSTLYVTSAWDGLSTEARASQPLAGALFAFEPGVKGLALPLFQG
jgi:sugar lactone lactonase YvrE